MIRLITKILKHPKTSMFLAAIAGSAVTNDTVANFVRGIPTHVGNLFRNNCMVSVEIRSMDATYPWINAWLIKKMGNDTRHMRVVAEEKRSELPRSNNDDDNEYIYKMYPNTDMFRFWHNKRLFNVRFNRNRNHTVSTASNKQDLFETITISTYGRDASVFKEIIDECFASASTRQTLRFFMNGRYGFTALNSLFPRDINTVYIDPTNKDKILADIQWFLDNKQWYRKRNIPYRRGYLFYGPPGTGKTSFVVALATHFDLPLFAVNIGSIDSDKDLIDTLRNLPERCICLIEDIDIGTDTQINTENPLAESDQKFSLSALINVIDGVYATDNRIMIMTTNNISALDARLIRPGRIDCQAEFNKIGNKEVVAMMRNFYEAEFTLKKNVSIIPSDLQQKILENIDNPKAVLNWLESNYETN